MKTASIEYDVRIFLLLFSSQFSFLFFLFLFEFNDLTFPSYLKVENIREIPRF